MHQTVLELADHFSAAAIDGTQWIPALEALANATGSSHGQLIGIGGPTTVPFNWVTGFPEEAIADFVAIEGGDPFINPRVAVALPDPVMKLRAEPDYQAAWPRMRSDIYADFCRDYDIPNGCQTKLSEDRNGLIGLALLRSERDGWSSDEQRTLFAMVAPHVRGAVRMQTALEHEGVRLMCGAFEVLAAAIFICAANGHVRAMTPAAEALLASERMRMTDGKLAASTTRDSILLQQALSRQASVNRPPLETLVLGVQPGMTPVILDVCAAPAKAWQMTMPSNILVIARTGQRWHSAAPSILSAIYKLSPAEADIALRLGRGESRDAIAAARDAKIDTVRAQIKSIFAKLGVSREVELVALITRMLHL